MSSRPALMLLFVIVLTAAVCFSSVCLAPVGHGSFSAVHGPSSIFVAKRAAARILSSIRITLVIALLLTHAGWINMAADVALCPPDRQLVTGILTC